MKTHDTEKTQTIIIAYYLHIFNSTILQFYDSTGKHTYQKKLKLHWLLLTYIQFYNSTILRFYRKKHVTKKTQTSLTATYIYSILQFYISTILQENTHHQKNSNFIDCYLHIFNSTIQQFYDSTGKHTSPKKPQTSLHTTCIYSILRFYMKTHIKLCFKINIHITCTHVYM